MLAIRDGDWKLLFNPNRSRVELYDMQSEQTELHSVAETHPDVVEALAQQALQWQKSLQPGPIVDRPGEDEYRWPRAIEITEDDILHD